MKRAACLSVGVGLMAVLSLNALADDKGIVVEFDNLKSTTPASWKEDRTKRPLRHMTFVVPRAKGDEADGDLAIFKGLGGSKMQNLDRWKGQFLPPEGKKADDIAKVEEIKIAGRDAMYVDIEGIYLEGPPMAPAAQKKKKPGYRMLAIHLDGPGKDEDVYHVKLIGPAKTVAEAKKGFDEWLKGFKK
jgi:hypothetical protein